MTKLGDVVIVNDTHMNLKNELMSVTLTSLDVPEEYIEFKGDGCIVATDHRGTTYALGMDQYSLVGGSPSK